MCGIFCIIYKNESDLLELNDLVKQIEGNIKRRGPDDFNTRRVQSGNYQLEFKASVLWLQGKFMTKQPLAGQDSVLAYNGDIFHGFDENECKSRGDTRLFSEELDESCDLIQNLEELHGPYGFIYLNQQKLYFGRDKFGRRSLLIGVKNGVIIITSVAFNTPGVDFMEIPTLGIFSYDLIDDTYQLLPWCDKSNDFDIRLSPLELFLDKNISHNWLRPHKIYNERILLENTEDYNHVSFLCALQFFTTNTIWLEKIKRLNDLLEESINKRVSNQPKFCRVCLSFELNVTCNHCRVGVLFSGGVDCTILALIADKFVDIDTPIDLLNVAFDTKESDFRTPDRITAESSFEELQALRPSRRWNLVKINVSQEELCRERSLWIKHLIYPSHSILDESLGCALWFASRGWAGTYISPCRVVLVGMGADELFGGYTKHRAALKHNGWDGLTESLELDWQNLPHRNLARDDRVVSDHGRQLRTPYLDEKFVEYIRSLKPWERTYPVDDVMEGKGDKFLLRSLAFYLGLKNAATFKKRALQFGSRIANNKENGNDRSLRL